jgi:hypothetical protein
VPTTSPSPRLRGRDERSSLLEGWGEGDSQQGWTRGKSPSPEGFAFDLSPLAGRGNWIAEQRQLQAIMPHPFLRAKNALKAATASFERIRSPNKWPS